MNPESTPRRSRRLLTKQERDETLRATLRRNRARFAPWASQGPSSQATPVVKEESKDEESAMPLQFSFQNLTISSTLHSSQSSEPTVNTPDPLQTAPAPSLGWNQTPANEHGPSETLSIRKERRQVPHVLIKSSSTPEIGQVLRTSAEKQIKERVVPTRKNRRRNKKAALSSQDPSVLAQKYGMNLQLPLPRSSMSELVQSLDGFTISSHSGVKNDETHAVHSQHTGSLRYRAQISAPYMRSRSCSPPMSSISRLGSSYGRYSQPLRASSPR